MTELELQNRVSVFVAARSLEARNRQEKENAAALIKVELNNRGVKELWVSLHDKDYKISYKNYTKRVFDTQRFRAENPGLYAAFMKSLTVKQFTVE